MNKKTSNSLCFLYMLLASLFISGCGSNNGNDLAITKDVLQNKWKPVIRQELLNYYNTKYMAPISEPTKMLAMLDKINSLSITEIKLRERGVKKMRWSWSNQNRSSYINVTYKMADSPPPDGITKRQLKVIISGINRIDRIEGL